MAEAAPCPSPRAHVPKGCDKKEQGNMIGIDIATAAVFFALVIGWVMGRASNNNSLSDES